MYFHFSMNSLCILIAGLSIFDLITETTSFKEVQLYKSFARSPLVLLQKHDTTKLRLAIPYDSRGYDHYVSYKYDDSEVEINGNRGSKEKLIIACTADTQEKRETEHNWKTAEGMSKYDELLFILESTSPETTLCSSAAQPSIKKMKKEDGEWEVEYCSKLQAEMYEVGYPVSKDDDGSDVQFLHIYKVCYSKSETEGEGTTRYSIHRIESPSLLLRSAIIEVPEFSPWDDYNLLVLDSSLSIKKTDYERNKYIMYQFVQSDHMPNKQWEVTTEFLFNYTLITRNADLFKGMTRADIYTKLYSKKNNKPLTLYSGTYEQLIENEVTCITSLCTSKPQPTALIKSFWRIIMDDNGHAIIIVTQHTPKKCGRAYLCQRNRQVKTYRKGGCIYTCSLEANDRVFELLSWPSLKITGDLDFTFQTDKTTKTSASEEHKLSNTKSAEKISIMDFLKSPSLKDVLTKVDAELAKNVNF